MLTGESTSIVANRLTLFRQSGNISHFKLASRLVRKRCWTLRLFEELCCYRWWWGRRGEGGGGRRCDQNNTIPGDRRRGDKGHAGGPGRAISAKHSDSVISCCLLAWASGALLVSLRRSKNSTRSLVSASGFLEGGRGGVEIILSFFSRDVSLFLPSFMLHFAQRLQKGRKKKTPSVNDVLLGNKTTQSAFFHLVFFFWAGGEKAFCSVAAGGLRDIFLYASYLWPCVACWERAAPA